MASCALAARQMRHVLTISQDLHLVTLSPAKTYINHSKRQRNVLGCELVQGAFLSPDDLVIWYDELQKSQLGDATPLSGNVTYLAFAGERYYSCSHNISHKGDQAAIISTNDISRSPQCPASFRSIAIHRAVSAEKNALSGRGLLLNFGICNSSRAREPPSPNCKEWQNLRQYFQVIDRARVDDQPVVNSALTAYGSLPEEEVPLDSGHSLSGPPGKHRRRGHDGEPLGCSSERRTGAVIMSRKGRRQFCDASLAWRGIWREEGDVCSSDISPEGNKSGVSSRNWITQRHEASPLSPVTPANTSWSLTGQSEPLQLYTDLAQV
ncbi:hypothetical protein GE09DRAFT_455238 [Coniochaeta sp. 2T2.1]|nr:hypothetical protein GE09DRAFT_455238 [Coniochaeta sp. 2T2.1]